MQREEFAAVCHDLLAVARFQDYCPNGLQVEGRPQVQRVLSGVTASLALIDEAIAWQADALLVHHGYFWKQEDPRLLGMKRNRLARLLAHDLNLFAYHLPLDAHPQLGNNAQLALRLGINPEGQIGEQGLIGLGGVAATTLGDWAQHVGQVLQREPLVLGDPARPVRRVAWCTGGAQGYFGQAIDAGVDVYLTGEISEPMAHMAQESGVAFIAAGHHATERYGVQALGEYLQGMHGIEHRFVDLPNPA